MLHYFKQHNWSHLKNYLPDQSADFKEGVKRLSEVLKIPPHDDHLVSTNIYRYY